MTTFVTTFFFVFLLVENSRGLKRNKESENNVSLTQLIETIHKLVHFLYLVVSIVYISFSINDNNMCPCELNSIDRDNS